VGQKQLNDLNAAQVINRLTVSAPPCIYIYFIFYLNFSFHDVTHVQQFHQDYIGLPEDGASNAPNHVGAR
jgi:hypothetical protein